MHFWQSIKLLILLLQIHYGRTNYTELNSTLYKELPALYHLDDYDLCLSKSPSDLLAHSTYCLVYAEIVPNASSTLWQQVERVSQDEKHYFRHDRLFVGVCLERCKRELDTLSRHQIQQLYEGAVIDEELSSYYEKIHKRDSDERLHYDHLINSCLNRQFGGNFLVRSSIEYCVRANETLEHDFWDITVYALFLLLLLLNVVSSFYDYRLKQKQSYSSSDNSHYQKPLNTAGQTLLCSFSLCRNYYRLTLPHASDFSKDLRFFDTFRVFGVFAVVLGHALILFMAMPVDNPQFYEQFFYKFETSLFQNGSAVIQIFFLMSAFLLYINFTQRQLINPKSSISTCIGVYFRVFFNRYIRLLPSLVVLILFNATILTRLQDGPFWRHITEAERVFCRENWWKNIFFITNYMLEESCAQQTWYMGADMQLFELFLIIIIITKKHPQLERFFNILLWLATFSVPALLTYFLKLEAVYHTKPETYRYLYFRNSETFYQIYTPFYTNLGGYILGFLCGKFYLKIRSSTEPNPYRGKFRYEVLIWLLLPASLVILFSGYIFMKYDFEKPSIWLALYAGLYKNLWVLICAGFVCGMCLKLGWIAYAFCTLPLFRPLARISFQAYLWHVVVLRLLVGFYRQAVYVNRLFLFSNVLSAFVLTQFVAFIMALFIEYPLVEVSKVFINHTHSKSAKYSDGHKSKSVTKNSTELNRV